MIEEINMLKNKKIGLITGGISPERKIAIKGGDAVEKAIKNLKLKYIKLDLNNKNRMDIFGLIKKRNIDVVFLVLHGRYGEDGTIQGGLDIIKVPYTGSGVLGSALAMDKVITKKILIQNNIRTPSYQVLSKGEKLKMNLTVVVKPIDCGSTIGISIVEKLKNLKKAYNIAFKYGEQILVEKYIKGKEITVPIFNDKPLPVIEIISKTKFYDYKAKYVKGMSTHILPADLPSNVYNEAQNLAIKTHKLLNLKCFSRVDMIYGTDKKIYVLEANSLPGLTKTSLLPESARSCGISFEEMVLRMLIDAIKGRK